MIDVILPVLDESDALAVVLPRMPSGYQPIVVDNGSRDGSGAIATSLGARVVCETRRGFGAACFAGLEAATSDIVCFMDGDGSLDPQDLRTSSSPSGMVAPTSSSGPANRRRQPPGLFTHAPPIGSWRHSSHAGLES